MILSSETASFQACTCLVLYLTLPVCPHLNRSPEAPFIADTKGNGTTPTEEQTWLTDAGPFGYINGSYTDNSAYEQVQWLRNDLAQVDRNATPFIFVMGHRPMCPFSPALSV